MQTHLSSTFVADVLSSSYPEYFKEAIADISHARIRPEIVLEQMTPPAKLAPHSFALGLSIFQSDPNSILAQELPIAYGRIIFLYDPDGQETWNGTLRAVVYLESEIESYIAQDPLLPEVGWSWLNDMLNTVEHTTLGGTVTCTSSYRYGDIVGPSLAYQLEIRASWTVLDTELHTHVEAFSQVLAVAAGLPPQGVASIHS